MDDVCFSMHACRRVVAASLRDTDKQMYMHAYLETCIALVGLNNAAVKLVICD